MRFRKKTWRETSVEDLLMPNEYEAEPAVLGKGDEDTRNRSRYPGVGVGAVASGYRLIFIMHDVFG